MDQIEKLEALRHSASHVMAQAVKDLFPDTKLGIGPATADGFYYDFDTEHVLSAEDFPKIEERMRENIASGSEFRRSEVRKEEARKLFGDRLEKYKLELIEGIEGDSVTLYAHDDFVDLCAGPHLRNTSDIRAFKLLSVAGAYWRGDEHNPMLQRIYGTAFPSEPELDDYLARLEEAKKRDHRKLGPELDLFSIRNEIGPGLVLWHPKGFTLRRVIEEFWYAEHKKRGYQFVRSPHIARASLWDQSGHTSFYADSMFGPITAEQAEYRLKPMNCPFHVLIYTEKTRSYRDLPIRYAELGTVYRFERGGVLHGMLRVRGFTQDDAHIFCRPDQLKDEVKGCVAFAFALMEAFDYTEFRVDLSVRDPKTPEKYLGTDDMWAMAEKSLADALQELGRDYHRAEGEAVFYGPKIDIQMYDALGRTWQGTTVQFDFNLPERFGVVYVGEDGKEHHPYMVHRALLGAMERFVGALIEHYGGAFPAWLAPVQIRVLPISEPHIEYASLLGEELTRRHGWRIEVDSSQERIGKKIREGEIQKIPYLFVVGEKEKQRYLDEDEFCFAVRKRGDGDLGQMTLPEFEERFGCDMAAKVL